MLIKFVYIIFVGILLAIFVGVGIATFYSAPEAPEYPIALEKPSLETAEEKAQADSYRLEQKEYQEVFAVYNRNVSLISLGFAVVFLMIGILLEAKIDLLADGLLLGGSFTLVYSLIRGLMTEENTYRFIVVSVALVIVLILGYLKFVRPVKLEPRV